MGNPISADQIRTAGNRNPNPNAGDRSHTPQNPDDDRDQRLHHLFSAVQNLAASRDSSDGGLAASRDSSDGGRLNPVSVESPAASVSRKRPLQTDFYREVSLFNAHFGSEIEKSRWAKFLPEHLRPGNLENYLNQTNKPQLYGDNFWWASQESSGQGDLPPPSCRQPLLCKEQPILRTTAAPTCSNTADRNSGFKKPNRRKRPVVKDGKKNLQSFKPCSRSSDHIQYSREQLLQLREVKSLSEAILKIKQGIEVEFGELNQIVEHGAILVDSSGARRENGSTSNEKKEDKKVANIVLNENEEPKTGDKAKEEDFSKKKKRGMSGARRARRKMNERKKRAEKNWKLGVSRPRIPQIQKPKPVSHCRHYILGRCNEGEKCKFSHDVVPLTKSKACCHFARQECMKGDDCPFDHQLSKYPCNNYVSDGFCNRGENCLFSHEITPNQGSVITPEAKSLNPSHSKLETGKPTVGIRAENKPAQERKGLSSNHKQASVSLKYQPVSEAGTPTSSGTSKGTPASMARSSVQAYTMEHTKDNMSISKGNEPVKPPKGFTFLNDSARGVLASQKTSNGVEAGVLSNQGTISDVSNPGKVSEAPSVSTSTLTGIFTFGKSSLDNHGENTRSSFPNFGNSCSFVASAGDKKDSVDTTQKANIVPFNFPASTSSSTPFLTKLDNAQVKNTISSGKRSLLSTLNFASKCASGATRSPLISSPVKVNPSVGACASSDANNNSASSSAGSMVHKKPANPFETWEMFYEGNSQS